MQQINNWDDYRRKQVNINRSQLNKEVSVLLTKHYNYLHSKLVKYEEEEDIFNDTYLKLTYKYDPARKDDFLYCYAKGKREEVNKQ